jgi:hypothetical protein
LVMNLDQTVNTKIYAEQLIKNFLKLING